MCGISGFFSLKAVNPMVLRTMSEIITHRGPDGEGFYFYNTIDKSNALAYSSDTPEKVIEHKRNISEEILNVASIHTSYNLGIAHRRLSIIDLSHNGHQPMSFHHNDYWITFNGEIYNYKEIRNELRILGCSFKTETDTEVILQAWLNWGEDCLNKFVGMWAFALLDKKKQSLYLVRDRFGIKPLYYYENQETIYFGSEIKQFTKIPDWKSKLNHQNAFEYLNYSFTDHNNSTMFDGVNNLQPGHLLVINLQNNNRIECSIKKWYKPAQSTFEGSYEEALYEFSEIFSNCIELHLRSDVPLGFALSGGIDSTSILGRSNEILKSENISHVINTFSACSENEIHSEKEWIDLANAYYKTNPNLIYAKGNLIKSSLPALTWIMDEPYQSQSAFLGYHIYASVKSKGIKVLLNGQGADEILNGYGAFRLFEQTKNIESGRLKHLWNELSHLTFTARVKWYFVILDVLMTENKLKSNSILTKPLAVDKFLNRNILSYKKIRDPAFNDIFDIAIHQLTKDPLPKFLRWEDRNSMAHSIESRIPFLDHRLVEFCLTLPMEFRDTKFNKKRILVDSVKNIIPTPIANRQDKKGFMTSEETWMKGEYRDDFLSLISESIHYSNGIISKNAEKYIREMTNGIEPFSYNYWRLIQFGFWMKAFNVSP